MNFLDIFIIATGLAMDCFAVAITCGMILNKFMPVPFIRISLLFGLFQGLMPIIGWLVFSPVLDEISFIDHWIAFTILGILGAKMIIEYHKHKDFKDWENQRKINPLKLTVVLVLALATSIDALAIGITFATMSFKPFMPAITIGLITLVLSFTGLMLGYKYSCRLRIPSELLGGLVLIGIGTKILVEHLFF